jgi:hypothetical protein
MPPEAASGSGAAGQPDGGRAELEAKVAFLRGKLAEKRSSMASKMAARAQAFAAEKTAAASEHLEEAWAEGEASGSGDVFRHTAGGVSRLRSPTELAREDPGKLYSLGLEEVTKFLGNRLGDGAASGEAPSVVTYLQAIFHGYLPQNQLGHRATRELATVGACLDSLSKGDLPHLGDLLMQRFKKLEVEALEGHEKAGETLELLPGRPIGLAGQQELESAQAEEIRVAKVSQVRRGRTGAQV